MDKQKLKYVVESVLLAAGKPLSIDRLLTLFLDDEQVVGGRRRVTEPVHAPVLPGSGLHLCFGFGVLQRHHFAIDFPGVSQRAVDGQQIAAVEIDPAVDHGLAESTARGELDARVPTSLQVWIEEPQHRQGHLPIDLAHKKPTTRATGAPLEDLCHTQVPD